MRTRLLILCVFLTGCATSQPPRTLMVQGRRYWRTDAVAWTCRHEYELPPAFAWASICAAAHQPGDVLTIQTTDALYNLGLLGIERTSTGSEFITERCCRYGLEPLASCPCYPRLGTVYAPVESP